MAVGCVPNTDSATIRPTPALQNEAASSSNVAGPESPQPPSETPDERATRQILGVWSDNYQGKRTMTLQPDGVGSIVVELEGMTANLFAAQLTFEIRWKVENGRLHKKVLGGEPKARVNMVLSTLGDETDEEILELTPDRLLLLDKDGKTQYDWRRLRANGD
jgi:hypothetical protein